jgi:hypothetical protein
VSENGRFAIAIFAAMNQFKFCHNKYSENEGLISEF